MAHSRVYRSRDYKDWYNTLSEKVQRIIDARIDKYRLQDELINVKSLDSDFGLFEFKWNNGMRVYFAFIQDQEGNLMLLLLGGNKNSQPSDIVKAKKIVLNAVTKIETKGKSS